MLLMFVTLALVNDRLTIDAVVIETLLNDASVQQMFVILASVPVRLTIEAVVIETLLNEAFVDC